MATETVGKRKESIRGVSLIVIGIVIVAVAADALVDSLDASGVVDRQIEVVRFASAALGAILVGLGANTVLKAWTNWPWFGQLAMVVLVSFTVIAAATWLLVDRSDQEFFEGQLNEDDPFDHRTLLSGGNGNRYYITLDTSPALRAKFDVRGNGTPIPGILQDDGRTMVAEGVLVGATTWTAVISLLEGEGRFLLYVDSAEPEDLAMDPEATARGFDRDRSRAGYTFSLQDRSDVYIRVEASDDASRTPGLLLRDSDGTPMDNVAIDGDGEIFTRLPKGDYVLEVQGSLNQQFSLILNDRNPENPDESPPQTEKGDVRVPDDVSRQPEQVAVSRLTAAGFVVESVPVCSTSLANEGARVGTTRQVVIGGAGSVNEEVEVIGLDGEVIDELPAGTPLEVKVFNGLPCG